MNKFVIFLDRALQWRWRLVARNGEIVATSESYTTEYSARRSVERIKQIAPFAIIVG